MSFLDLDERLLGLFSKVDLMTSPISDVKEIPEVDVGLIDGGIGNDEELHIARTLRARCKILVVMGDCACYGGINTMRNTLSAEDVLREAYCGTVTTVNPSGELPGRDLPKLLPQAQPVDRVVKADVYIPGCPPDADSIFWVFSELLEGRVPKLPTDMIRYD
jgi:NAD-reducing hydrogenase small subunit